MLAMIDNEDLFMAKINLSAIIAALKQS